MEELTNEEIWRIAEAINESDGLIPSNYLKELIEENKKEKMTEEEMVEKLKENYSEKRNRR